jgi:N-acetylmuramoyl-L-alanine amidase
VKRRCGRKKTPYAEPARSCGRHLRDQGKTSGGRAAPGRDRLAVSTTDCRGCDSERLPACDSCSAAGSRGPLHRRRRLACAAGVRGQPRLWSRGRTVASLQRRLVSLGYLRRQGIDGIFGAETRNAVVAFQGWELIGRDGVVGPRTRRSLGRASAPEPWRPLRRALEIDLRRQVLLVVEAGVVSRAIHVSSGALSATPEGRFTIVRRMRESWSKPYRVWLPYALYFYRGLAIHGFPSVPDRPASHGCIRIPVEDAAFVFRAAPLGTSVLIRGARRP